MKKVAIGSSLWRYHRIRKRYQEKRHSQKWLLRKRYKNVEKRRILKLSRTYEQAPYVVHVAPKNFSFINNTNEVLQYFLDAQSIFYSKKNVEFDIKDVDSMTPDTIALLVASIKSSQFTKQGTYRGNNPEKPELDRLLTESGFGEHVSSTGFKKAKSGNLLHKEVNKKVVPKIAKEASITGLAHVHGDIKPFPPLYEILVEAMSNTHNHANLGLQGECKWWLYVYNDPHKKTSSYSFVDLGVGIFGSAVVQIYARILNLITFSNDRLVDDLLEGKIHSRIEKDKELRGKGIPQIVKHAKHPHFKVFYIITNNVKIDLKTGGRETLHNNFKGTFLYWELINENGNQG